MEQVQKSARTKVQQAMNITGWKSTRLARAAGIAPSTLNRFLSGDVKHTLSARTIAKIDAAVVSYLNEQPFSPEVIANKIRYFREAPPDLEPVDAKSITIQVRGTVQAGVFSEATEWPVDEWEPITLPRPDSHRTYFGLRVMGPSMNLVYPEGTILVCVPFHEYNHRVTTGDHVIVQRNVGFKEEATVKEIQITKDGRYWLWPKSDHPEHQTPIEIPTNYLDEPDFDGTLGIRITAVVVADYRIRKPKSPDTL